MNRVWLVTEIKPLGCEISTEQIVGIFDSEEKAKADVEDRYKQLLECGQTVKYSGRYSVEERIVQ